MAQAFLTANSYLGLSKEATRGTVGSTAVWIPVMTPQVTPKQKFLRDEALRGSPVMVYDQVAATRADDVEFKSYVYADSIGVLLQALLGSDTSTTSGSNYSHALKLLNAASSGSQPASYTLMDFDGANSFTINGAQADSMTFSFGAEVAAEATTKFIGNPYTSATTPATPFTSYSNTTLHPIPAWDTTVTIGGTAFTNVSSGEIKIERKTQSIFTMNGTQAPYVNFAGPLEVSGKMTLVVATTTDPFSTGSSGYGLTRDPLATVITLVDPNSPAGAYQVGFTMTQTQYQNVKRTRGKEYVELEVEFTANANATDGGSASTYSPIAATVVNGTSAAY